eukprot:PITA_07589
MKSLPDSLGNFTNLQHIDLSSCKDLQMLPPSFGNLTKLQHVKLTWCVKLRVLPDSFRNLVRLKHLDLTNCSNLTLSGETLGNISTLETLNLSGCPRIEVLPPQVTHQLSLEELFLEGTELKELPWKPCRIHLLTHLSILSSPIREVPFGSVQNVQGGLRLLDSSIDNCMFRLIHLDLSRTRITEISFGEGVCPVLKYLNLSDCADLVEVGALPTTLTSLDLSGCCALKKITALRGLAKLKRLNMGKCKTIKELPGLAELNNLEYLFLFECPISVVVPFASVEKVQRSRLSDLCVDKCMLRLRELYLKRARISEISFGEGVCPALERLDLTNCKNLVEVGALPTSLKSLRLSYCSALKKVTGLPGLAKLKDLYLKGCYSVEELPDLETLISLQTFWISECENMNRILVLAEAANPEIKRVIGIMKAG